MVQATKEATKVAAEPDRHTSIFSKADWLVALVTTLISGAVYFYTVQPNVGLLDSGEFIVAGQHFGVPHPTGYPLWTILVWLFQVLLPIGNAAWEVNLFSAFCGALAVGVTTLIASSFLRWMMPWWGGASERSNKMVSVVVAASFGLLFAFSFSFWTQAVIAEVYTLHGLLVALFMTSIYWWVRRPERDLPIFAAFFTFALGMSNHHLMLALAPLPIFVPLLIRRSVFWEVLVGAVFGAALVYIGFAWLSKDATTWATAMRFFYFVMFGLIALLVFKWRRTDLRVIFLIPLMLILGLLPYAYMPIASSTNPPMNWGYTSTPEGFYYSINRSQYSGSLSDLIVKTLGKGMGTVPEKPPEPQDPERISTIRMGIEFSQFYWARLIENFTWWSLISMVAALFAIFKLPLRQRTFLYVLFFGFILAAFVQPIMERTETTIDAWSLQFPYHGYAYLIFALFCAAGSGYIFARLMSAKPAARYAAWLLPLLPLWTAWQNESLCTQRDHWFGWEYGHDMLNDLPKGAFVFGGTDPGRFVPTYMILGESFVDPKYKRDSNFDRRDLVIVTQNALADAFYQKYIRDHYGEGRPQAKGWFEKWLGREDQYPKETTKLPNDKEIAEIIQSTIREMPPGTNFQDPSAGMLFHAGIAKWIFEHNKNEREFFIEESFPMEWTYAYAIPHGLVYKLNKDPLEKIPDEAVEADFKYWDAYVAKLLADKKYQVDFDAKRSFSKLRNSIANIYRWRGMLGPAEKAYRQALQLHPNNLEAAIALSEILRVQKRWEELKEIWDRAVQGDPNNRVVQKTRERITKLREADRDIESLRSMLRENPKNAEALSSLLRLYVETGQPDIAKAQLQEAANIFGNDQDFIRFAVEFCNANGFWDTGLDFARKLATIHPQDASIQLVLARFEFTNRNLPQFMEAAKKAIQIAGMQAKATLANDPLYASILNTTEFQQLLQQN